MKTISKISLVAAAATSCMLAITAPAFAYGEHGGGGHGGGGGGHFGGGGGHFGGGGHGFGGGHGGYGHGGYGGGGYGGAGYRRGGYEGGYGHGGWGFGRGGYGRGGWGYGGWGYGGALLGGLGLGYALDSYYDGDDGDYVGGPGQCMSQQQVWDPAYGSYVVEPTPYAC